MKMLTQGNGWESEIITVGELKKILADLPDGIEIIVGNENSVDYITHIKVGKHLIGLFSEEQ